MKIGDHLVSPRTAYNHHGIYTGEQVIHYSGFSKGMSKGQISKTSLEEFSQGNTISVELHSKRKYGPEESIKRASRRLGEDWYDVLLNNCEHFVTWCILGTHSSSQINALIQNSNQSAQIYSNQNSNHSLSEAVSRGLIGGVVSASTYEICKLVSQHKKLTEKEFIDSTKNIILAGIEGAARTGITTSIQNAGKSLAHKNSKLGQLLVKSGPATILANMSVDLIKNLYQLSTHKIDSIELMDNVLQSGTNASGGYYGGVGGIWVAESLGVGLSFITPLGPMGPLVCAVIGGVVGATGFNLLYEPARTQGMQRVQADISSVKHDLSQPGGIYQYIDVVGTQSKYKFEWSHLIPCYGTFGQLSEYKARKDALKNITQQLHQKSAALDGWREDAMQQLESNYQKTLSRLETNFSQTRHAMDMNLTHQGYQLASEFDVLLKSRQMLQQLSDSNTFQALSKIAKATEHTQQKIERTKAIQILVQDLKRDAQYIQNEEDRQAMLQKMDELIQNNVLKGFVSPREQAQLFFYGRG